ncbi:hypothetical protein BDA99DRAFT_517773 [Phascolomyces articulosus]|uniref:Uncharacterized protein n=1 Tax=Phascolomyces articulosus TaxID=60185 RepID=A0AAD5PBG2_9FUNG|nr:hypothetical protein BDA99DRAFT_517773 [Phascolomyces articulosus]
MTCLLYHITATISLLSLTSYRLCIRHTYYLLNFNYFFHNKKKLPITFTYLIIIP